MNEVSLVFARNLRLLAQAEQSVTKLCLAIDVNRQQFNKYLRGEHLPSRRNLARIASYFKIAEKDLFLDTDTFHGIWTPAIAATFVPGFCEGTPRVDAQRRGRREIDA